MGGVVEVLVVLVGDDAVEVASHGADVAVDGPLIVIEDDDEALGLRGDVVERLVGDAVGEGGVAGDGDDVLLAAGEIAGHGHAERRGERRAGVAGAVAVVLALSAEHEAVEAAGLADGGEAIGAAGEQLVHVSLVADVEEELVVRGVEDGVQGQGELDDAEVGAEMAAGPGKRLDQKFADLRCQFGHLRRVEALEVGRRVDGLQQCSHVHPSPGKGPVSKKKAPRCRGHAETAYQRLV